MQPPWQILECQRVLYVSKGRNTVLVDRGHSGPVTILVQLAEPREEGMARNVKNFWKRFWEYLDPKDGATNATIWRALKYAWRADG